MTSNALSSLSLRQQNGLVVLDGHDGAGKSTVLERLQEQVGGCVVKPFRDSLGDLIVWLIADGQYELANKLALQAVEKGKRESVGPEVRWFDRHWLSLFTLLPESCHEPWLPLPPTVLCWANPDVTMRRLSERGEQVGDPEQHRFFCRRYLELAKRFRVPVVDTSDTTANEATNVVLKWLQ